MADQAVHGMSHVGTLLATDKLYVARSPYTAGNDAYCTPADFVTYGAGFEVVAASAVAAVHTGSTAETVVATIAIPAPGANGIVRIDSLWSAGANNANVKTGRVRLVSIGGTTVGQVAVGSALSANRDITMLNRNNSSSQICFTAGTTTSYGQSTSANTTASVDTSAGFNIVLTAQLADGSDSITCEAYIVSILRRS